MKYKIILFQKYLRSHILNFRKNLKEFEFVLIFPEESTKKLYQRITTFENETARKKTNFILLIRRILGIPNARLKFFKNGDLIFTYGCLLFTNKPYCVYIENGISIYKYDPVIAKNPLAKFIFNYKMKLGFLDGCLGLFQAYLMSVQSLSVRVFQWCQKS